jgi:peptidoglycan/LPS O-acetylase OafA/YrhL
LLAGDLAFPDFCVAAAWYLPMRAEGGTEVTEVLPAVARPVAGRPGTDGRGFRPDIQGLRALAVSMVMIYHLYPSLVPGGFAGVDVFFVISGFLITGHLWRGYQRDGRVRLLDFWGRRARRLVPAAALVLTVTWFASWLMLPASRLADTAGQIRASALYYQNWQLAHQAVNYLTADEAATPVQHFWSLSVEEQFYLVWPLLFVVAALVSRRRGAVRSGRVVLAGLVVTLTAASLAYSVYETRVDPAAAYFVTTTRMWELGAGGLLAMLPERLHRVLRRQGWLGWAGLAAVLASAFVLGGTSAFPGALALLPVSGAVMLIAGGSDLGRQGPARLMSARPMLFLGGISYSLYLWHWPMISLWTTYTGKSPDVLSGPALIAASLAAAWWTKTYVEDPVRLWPALTGHRWRSVSTALAAALPVALVSAYLVSVPGQWDGALGPGYPGAAVLAGNGVSVPAKPVLPPPDDALAAIPQYWQQGCLDGAYAVAPKVCTYGDTTDPAITVALVGDSIAGNWFPALDELALRYHWKLVTDLHATCPWTATWMTDPNTSVAGVRYTACHEWDVTVQHDLLTSIHPDVVITSDFAQIGSVAHPQYGPAAYTDIAAGMAQYWKQLQAHGISVVPIQETPMMEVDPPDCVSEYGAASPACDRPAAEAIPRDSPIVQAARLMAGTVKVIDMNQFICAHGVCRPVVGNVLVYFDVHHLTSSYVTTTTPYLALRLFGSSAVLASHRT